MKRNRITSALLAFFMVFSLIGMLAQPAYAVKAKDVGITVSNPTRSYSKENGTYGMKITLYNNSESKVIMGAYLYNADGKKLASWTNKDKYYSVKSGEKKTINFTTNYNKFSGDTFIFQLSVKGYDLYNWDKGYYEDIVFKWKWTITREEACTPSISFKKMTFRTLDDGRVVPRINIKCKNIKGQSLRMYIYDEYGDLVYDSGTGKKRTKNEEDYWYSWGGKVDGQQYPDGYYIVKVVSSGGLSIKQKFYFDFPYNNK